MGRKIRRVPLDFDHPIGEVWPGYVMPDLLHGSECPSCTGDGLTPQSRAIEQTFYPNMIGGTRSAALAWHDKIGQVEVDNLIAKGRLATLVDREPTPDDPRTWKWISLPRSAEEVNAAQRNIRHGHDAINRCILVEFRCAMLGIPLSCTSCAGEGTVETCPGQRDEAESWRSTEPPTGDGWQMWETVSEGSPVSPVFPTAETLAQWLTTPEGGKRAGPSGQPMSIDQARGFVHAGSAPTLVRNVGGVHDGAAFVGSAAVLEQILGD